MYVVCIDCPQHYHPHTLTNIIIDLDIVCLSIDVCIRIVTEQCCHSVHIEYFLYNPTHTHIMWCGHTRHLFLFYFFSLLSLVVVFPFYILSHVHVHHSPKDLSSSSSSWSIRVDDDVGQVFEYGCVVGTTSKKIKAIITIHMM